MALIVVQSEPDDSEEDDDGGETDGSDEEMPWRPVGAIILSVVGIYFMASLLAGINASNEADGQTHAPSVITDLSSTAGQESASIDGAILYQQACAACHGAQLEGVEGLGNTLAPSDFVAERSDDEMLAFIREGRNLDDPDNTTGLVMPESGGRPDLTDPEMLAIIQHIRTEQPDTE
jgi:cytochrome c5